MTTDQDPDAMLRDFASDLNARGYRAVGLVQLGHIVADSSTVGACWSIPAKSCRCLQDLDRCASGCRLDVGQASGRRRQIADAIEAGADLVIVNRFGQQEREGKGLAYLIERALERRYSGRDRGARAIASRTGSSSPTA